MRLLERLADAFRPAPAAHGDHDASRDVDRIGDINSRQKARITGVVSSLVIHPATEHEQVEISLSDGTGSLTIFWMGRDHIDGIEPGARVEVSGFVAMRGGMRVMYNPRYTIDGTKDDDEL
ncbi:MAG: OB-fold nucleic acid binding domain-containing protein [Dermabacter sp.]|nr:OB-fold nucleic acid binding domain-containing protein [Dermabacter sp.]